MVTVQPWTLDEAFLNICIEGVPPCLVEDTSTGKFVISTARGITEYVADSPSARNSLHAMNPQDRAEARRLAHWFDLKFSEEVNAYILTERLEKSLTNAGAPDPANLRIGREHLKFHLEYFSWLLENRDWLAGRTISLAEIAAGAHISCLDFCVLSISPVLSSVLVIFSLDSFIVM